MFAVCAPGPIICPWVYDSMCGQSVSQNLQKHCKSPRIGRIMWIRFSFFLSLSFTASPAET